MWQLQYEQAEWDWCMDIIHKRGSLYMYGASVLGMLIPPSVLLIIWGIITETSIGGLFLAGVIRGPHVIFLRCRLR